MQEPAQGTRLVRFGAFEVNLATGELRKHGIRLRIQEQPFQVLAMLLERPGQLVTRAEFQQKLWLAGTFVDFENGLNTAINKLREVLGDSAENPRFVGTEPRRGYRFLAPVEVPSTLQADSRSLLGALLVVASRFKWRLMPSLVAIATLATATFSYLHRAPKLTGNHSIVIASFKNTTGDAVFDGTLRQGLAVQLEQSPFLDLISDDQIQQTLRLMEQAPDAKLTIDLAKQVCQRVDAVAVLDGSVDNLGGQYVIGVRAADCHAGRMLAQTQTTASEKSKVLSALGKAGAQIRTRLGESLASIQKYDTQLEDVTTPSLEALQAYTLGVKALRAGDVLPARAFFERATSLDPNFAMAYDELGVAHGGMGSEPIVAEQNTRKAYDLRDRVSEKERLAIEDDYHETVTGDMEKLLRVCQLWAQTYPRDIKCHFCAAHAYKVLQQYDNFLAEEREVFRLSAGAASNYGQLAKAYLSVGRLREAKEVAREGAERMPHFRGVHLILYMIAFLEKDEAGMAEQVAWANGKPRDEEGMIEHESNAAAYYGKLAEADTLTRRAIASAERAGEEETAAGLEAGAALPASLLGNASEAKRAARAALQRSKSVDVECSAAIALALSGDASQARKLADDLAKRFPENTEVRFKVLPEIRASIALSQNHPLVAIAELQAGSPYEQSEMLMVYLRGMAYLATHQGEAAAAEFDKILAHPARVLDYPVVGPLAHLGLARAHALQGHTEASRKAYQDLFELWRNADSELRILTAAKTEYSRLR